MDRNYAVFVISHGRAETTTTYDSLRSSGYSGQIYYVVDDEDNELELYQDKFENVLVFNKRQYMRNSDSMDDGSITKTPLYARNATIDFARSLGVEYCFMADDDIKQFDHRYDDGKMAKKRVKDLDAIFDGMVDFYETSDSHATLGLGSPMHYIGGTGNKRFLRGFTENVNQFFMFSIRKNLRFRGTFEEDFLLHMDSNRTGNVCLCFTGVEVVTGIRGENSGGLNESYKKIGGAVDNNELYRYRLIAHPWLIRFFNKSKKFQKNSIYISPCIVNERYKK